MNSNLFKCVSVALIFSKVVICNSSVMAATETVDGITWTYTVSNGKATVGGGRSSPAIATSTSGAITVPSTLGGVPVTGIALCAFDNCANITSAVIQSGVTIIGSSAFDRCSGLMSVTIPDSVTSIGSMAFRGCSGLTSVTIPDSVTNIAWDAFSGCSGIESVTVPFIGSKRGSGGKLGYLFGESPYAGGIATTQYYDSWDSTCYYIPSSLKSVVVTAETELGYGAFDHCSGITSVIIPSSVVSIGTCAFRDCSGLTSMTIPHGVTSIAWEAFRGCSGLTSVTIPDSVTSIGDSAFYGCRGLTEVTIPDSVTRIGNYAFQNCSGLTSVTIPNSVTNIGYNAFYGCSGLTSVTIPQVVCSSRLKWVFPSSYANISDVVISDSVTNITSFAFSDCSGLASVTIPNSVTYIGDEAFSGCSRLASVTIPDGVTSIGSSVLRGCSALTSVTIPESVTCIASNAFGGCSGLAGVTIPDSVTYIGDEAFSGCSSLTSVTIPESVTCIASNAFGGCSGLTGVTIPDSVTSIEPSAFSGCSGLKCVIVPNSVTNIGPGAFAGCSGLESITLPFVGSMRGNTGTADSMFGYVFGTGSYTGGVKTKQYYLSDKYATFYIPQSLREVTVTDETVLGHSAFCFCGNLTKVTLPESLTSIMDGGAFWECKSLVDVNIPNSVTNMGTSIFRYCSALEHIVMPDSVTSIGDNAFDGCSKLNSVTMPETIERIGDSAFAGCVRLMGISIPKGVKSIGDNAFTGCNSIVEVTMPSSLLEGTWRCGLLQAKFNALNDFNSSICDAEGRTQVSGTIMGYAYDNKNATLIFEDPLYGGSYKWNVKNTTFGYAGRMYMKTGRRYVFGEYFDDSAQVKIDGTVILQDTDHKTFTTGTYSAIWTGWHEIEVRLSDGTGERGPKGATSTADASYWSAEMGIGWRDDGKLAALPESDWHKLMDPGDGSLFRTYIDHPHVMRELFPSSYDKIASVTLLGDMTEIPCETFAGCAALGSIDIPSTVTSIGDYAFSGCSGLTSLTIPESVTYIGEHAFDGCDGLQYGDDGFLIVDGWVLGYDDPTVTSLVIPEGVVGIGGSAFADFWDLEDVTFPDSLKCIGGGAFDTCTGLDGVVIPDGVEIIGSGAFRNCTYLRDLTIGEGVAEIGKEAFAGCTQLSTLTIPDNVTEIGDAAFSNCWRMLSVKLPLGLEMVGTNMLAGCTSLSGATVPTHAFTMDRLFGDRYSALGTVTICSGETDVCASAFQGCTSLTSVVMPNSVTNIGASAFANCSSLTGLELSESLETIGQSTFAGCTALKAITLPDSVTAIGEKAFQNCTTLANVTLSRSVGEIPDRAFDGCKVLLSMVVPASVSSLGAYIGNNFSALYFLGNAPAYDANVYASRARNVTTYVVQGSRGWDGIASSRDLPTAWNGYPITFWEPNRFNASFNANGGTFFDGANAYACEQITDTAYALPPYEPTLEGFVFDGWWTDPYEGAEIKATTRVNETRDITFYAHWKGAPGAITVRFNANGGTVVPDEGQYYSTLTYETLPVPTREHYKFAGWWTKATGGSKVVASSRVPTADQELFAHWTPEVYRIRYHANGGEGTMQDQYFTYGGTVTLTGNGFSRADKSFVGWAVAADGPVVYANGATLTTFAAIQDGAVDLYAVWRGDSYAVRFDSNGGVGSMDNATFEMEEVRALPPCGFTRDGFDFAGWAVSPDGEVVYLDEAEVSVLTDVVNGSVVLYAVWQTYTVDAPVITPSDGAYFVGDSCEVSISCTTRDAVIYYSTTGKAPKLTDKNRYAGPFTITGTTKIYAVAVRGDVTAFMIATISKQELTLEYALGVDDKVGVSTSSEYSWVPVADAGAERGYCAVSALPAEDDMNSWIELTVSGAGRLTFKCRTSCEWDYTGECGFDCLMVEVDGVEAEGMRLDGIQNGWTARTIELAGTGEHKVRLIYHKDESDFDGEDCAWVDGVIWTPSGAAAGVSVEVNGAAVEFETAADGKTRTVEVAAGTTAEDVKVFVGGVDVTAGFKVAVDGTTATMVLKEPYETARSEIAPYQAWSDNGDGNVTLNVDVVPGLYYAADSAATIDALKRPGAAEPAKAGDAVVAPKQEGAQGFYKVWVSDAPIEAE